jgi:hypothetical protein
MRSLLTKPLSAVRATVFQYLLFPPAFDVHPATALATASKMLGIALPTTLSLDLFHTLAHTFH